MSKKVIKYILEMIFIFIIPLLFMLLGIEIKKVYTYDENNNVVSEEKIVDIKELDFINTEEKTYEKFIYYQNGEYNINGSYIYISKEIPKYLEDYEYNEQNNYSSITLYPMNIFFNENNDCSIFIKYIYYSYDRYLNVLYKVEEESDSFLLVENYEENENYIKINTNINLSEYKYLEDNECSLKYIKSIETKTIQENVFSKALNTLFDSLGIENNIIIQLVVIYFILWLIMFILWHIFYLPFDKLFHLRKE